jgi:hypothetical protein
LKQTRIETIVGGLKEVDQRRRLGDIQRVETAASLDDALNVRRQHGLQLLRFIGSD